jgi:hypothetical protein
MAVLTAARNRQTRNASVKHMVLPISNVKIFKGAIVMIDASGHAVNGSDTAALQTVGIAHETVDNSAGSAGAINVIVEYDAEFLFTATSITQAMLGDLMVCVDNDVVDDAAGATNDITVGRLIQFVSTTSGWVYVPGLSN